MDGGQPVRVRPYSPADLDQVLELAPRLTEGVAAWRDPAAVLAAVRGWVTSSAQAAGQPGHAMFVAEVGSHIAGLVSVAEHKHFTGQADAYVGELITAAGLERRGIGRQLMAAAERWAAERGLTRLTLQTGAANQKARAFYSALGYAEEDVTLTKPLAGAGDL
jgi:GNAT superfamily N-acetyltransferase